MKTLFIVKLKKKPKTKMTLSATPPMVRLLVRLAIEQNKTAEEVMLDLICESLLQIKIPVFR